MDDEDLIITIDDIRRTGHCVRGAGQWFALNQLDFRKFLREGATAAELLATNDDLARQVVNSRREHDAHGR